MSWLSGYSSKPKPSTSQEDQRESKRKKLEVETAERLLRKQQRARRQKQLQDAIKSREAADQALQELLDIDPDLFSEELSGISLEDIPEDILDEDIMDFDRENGTDGDKAVEKLSTIHCPFSLTDLEFWFSELEGQLEMIEVKAQWTKTMALRRFLPPEIKEEVKTLLKLSKTNAGDNIYHRIKQELLELFGKKPEDDYIRAKNRVLTGKPSQLGKALIDDICDKEVKLDGCCCKKTVWAMFRENLPTVIRNHVSEMTFTKDTHKAIFQKADQVWASNQASEPAAVARPTVAATAVATASAAKPASDPATVAAITTRRKPNKPNKNQQSTTPKPASTNATASATPATKPKGTRHPTAKGKDENLCRIHFSWGINATYCAAPWKCPMKDQWKAPQ